MGGKSAQAPDYSQLAAVSREAVGVARDLGQQQIDFSREQYEYLQPLMTEVAEGQIAAQQQQLEQAQDYYQYQTETFRPLEQGLVQQAQEFSTESYRERMAGEAAAASGRAFTNIQRSAARADRARGLNPNSAASRALREQSTVGQAASRSQQMTGARERAEQLGYARQLDAAGLGRGLAGASAAAYQGSVGAGSAGAGTYQQPGQVMMQGYAQGAGTMMQGYGLGIQGQSGVLNAQTNVYGSQLEKQGAIFGGLTGLAGAGIGALSDRRLKENIELHHRDPNSDLNVYDFNYVGEPNRRFRGVMADEVETKFPSAVIYDDLGYASVDYAEIGMRMIEVTGEAA